MDSKTYKQAFKPQRDRYAAEIRRQRRLLDSLCTCSHCEAGIAKTPAKWPRIALGLAILTVLLLLGVRCANAAETRFTSRQAILSIIGEAENQGYKGMLDVAHAIRNRGTLRGVYGLHNPRVVNHKYSVRTEQLATKAWKQSAITPDTTNGATNWENIHAFGKPYWVKSMIKTYAYKDHVFYKKICD